MANFTKISDIISEEAFSKKPAEASVKKGVAFGFWKNITGKRFANFSAPYDIKGGVLFVSVKNPQVMQELILNQDILMKKIKDYFTPLNITINSIRYDYKNWNKINSSVVLEGDETLKNLDYSEIEEVPLENFEKEALSKATNTISNLGFLSQELKTKYIKTIENTLKAKKLQKG